MKRTVIILAVLALLLGMLPVSAIAAAPEAAGKITFAARCCC